MSGTCSTPAGALALRATPVVLALTAALAVCSGANAASIGHARLVSASGQPLSISVPVRELTASDLQVLRVGAAPATAWQQAGLVPPVSLSSLRVSVEPGFADGSRVIQVRSEQAFSGPVADLLLQVDTAAGSRLHQVSLLAQGGQRVAVSSPARAGTGSQGVSGQPGAITPSSASQSISVRRGDTLFALARAHAVEGVSVYQMMIALQKANPQAFIESNINLVKAGAILSIPDASALREVSDAQARRIFQQQAQAYAAYRERIAAGKSAPVQGAAAHEGTVTRATQPAVTESSPAVGDQVVLSSAQQADAVRDEQDATRRNIDESLARVSQLERNVQSLNQALQMQGEAAKEAVVEGAAAVGQTLTEAASSIGLTDAQTTQASQSDSGSSGSSQSEAGPENETTSGEGQSALGSEVGASGINQSSSQATSGSGAEAAAGVESGGSPDSAAAASSATALATEQAGATASSDSNSSGEAEQSVSWLQEHMLGVITAILALVVLIIAWLLRRASASRSGEGQGVITEAMVQERLEEIDLNLDLPEDQSSPRSR